LKSIMLETTMKRMKNLLLFRSSRFFSRFNFMMIEVKKVEHFQFDE